METYPYTQIDSCDFKLDDTISLELSLAELLRKSAVRHDHLCPRQVLGVRMGLAGLAAIGVDVPIPQKMALVIIETDGCFADGIEVATGATVGHRTLRVNDVGKIAAVFASVQSGRAVRLAPRPGIREIAPRYAPGEKNKYRAQLQGYQLMPVGELFTFQAVDLEPSVEALRSQPGLRVTCARCGEEIINEREIRVGDQVLCKPCAGMAYFRAGPEELPGCP